MDKQEKTFQKKSRDSIRSTLPSTLYIDQSKIGTLNIGPAWTDMEAAIRAVAREQTLLPPVYEFILLSAEIGKSLAGIQECDFLMRCLVDSCVPLFSPSNTSLLPGIYFKYGALTLYRLTDRCVKSLNKFEHKLLSDDCLAYRYCAILVFHSLAEIRLNRNFRGVHIRLRRLLSRGVDRFHELKTQVLNLLSILYGKTEDKRYPLITGSAAVAANQGGLCWLEATIRFREEHKRSWADGESGLIERISFYEDELWKIVEDVDGLAEKEKCHIEGQLHAFLGLNYRWDPKFRKRAAEHIRLAEQAFLNVSDRAEYARVAVEGALLEQLLHGRNIVAVGKLKEAIQHRLLAGEYARTRYDLHWLAEIYRQIGHRLYADICEKTALQLHLLLYGAKAVDTILLREIKAELQRGVLSQASELSLAFSIEELRALEDATGVPCLVWRGMFTRRQDRRVKE